MNLDDEFLWLAAEVLDDIERLRIAHENRLRQLVRTETDKDGLVRGFRLTREHVVVDRQINLVYRLLCNSKVVLDIVPALKKRKHEGCCLEHDAERALAQQLRQNPLWTWMKAQHGIGPKQGARLLASIGDPYIRPKITRKNGTVEPERPRTVGELWAYTGYSVIHPGQVMLDAQTNHGGVDPARRDPGDTASGTQVAGAGVAPTRVRGQHVNWSPKAKMRARLIAETCVKVGGPYREVYDRGRAKYVDALHQIECKRCGPAGKPAPIGSALSDGHKHARALRLVAKTVLKDLWREARRLHTQDASSQVVSLRARMHSVKVEDTTEGREAG